MPDAAILVEPRATNTSENITYTRQLLAESIVMPLSVTLISRPYQQRRAYATCRKIWPEVEVICASQPLSLDDYIATIGDTSRVINMLVGDTQRIKVYADEGFAIQQAMPSAVKDAFRHLVEAGYSQRLIHPARP